MDALTELEARLDRYPADRYPVQHATTRFHLGALLADVGRAEDAAASLATSVKLFGRSGMPVERAKALNALGAALRLLGDETHAAAAFVAAAQAFREAGLAAEEAAALYNLGLVNRDPGALRGARERFAAAGERRAEAAAARELGTLLFEQGALAEAEAALADAVDLAERAGDLAGLGGGANARGLVQLAGEQPQAAVASFRAAAGAHPRGVRPAEHAMAKANLALAHEHADDAPRARLAAKQALAVAEAPQPVRAQAQAVLSRLAPAVGDLVTVLAGEPETQRLAVVREELVRWSECDPDELDREAESWVASAPAELTEPLLGALLELPPVSMQRIADALTACGDYRFRNAVERAAARFPPPQLLRLEQAFAWS